MKITEEGKETRSDEDKNLTEDEQNKKLRAVLRLKFRNRFFMDVRQWGCDICGATILTHDLHHHCFECNDFDICKKCYKKEGNRHKHKVGSRKKAKWSDSSARDWLVSMREPNWYFTYRMKEDTPDLTVVSLIISCFQYFSRRKFVGVRNSVKEPYHWSTYGDVFKQVKTLANGMRQLGLSRKDFICVLGDISLEYMVIIFACWYSGITVVPIQTILTIAEKKYIIKQCSPKAFFFHKTFEEEINQFVKVGSLIDRRKCFMIDKDESSTYTQYLEIQYLGSTAARMKPSYYDEKDICTIIYTSGTTGFPKGIVFRHKAWLQEMNRINFTMPLVLNSFLPYSHISGMTDFMLPFFNGGRVALLTNHDMKNVYEDFKAVNPTILSTIPRILIFVYNQYHKLIKTFPEKEVIDQLKGVYGTRLIEICVGSAPCSLAVKNLIRKIFKIPVVDGYGISEVGTVSFNFQKQGDVKYKLLDCPELGYLSTDKPYPRGELLVKNKLTQQLEYFKNKEMTKKKFNKDGYFHTGDIVELHGSKIILIDRKNNVCKLSQGEFVNLEKLETIYESSKYIDQMILTPDPPKLKIVAIVVALDHSVTENEVNKDIVRISKEYKINSWEVPKHLLIVNNPFQLTELKKKSRKRIKKQYSKELTQLFNKESSNIFKELFSQHIDLSKVDSSKSFKELGGDSLTGTILIKNLQTIGKNIDFNSLMNKPLKEILAAKDALLKNDSGKTGEIFVSMEKDKKEFKKLMREMEEKNDFENAFYSKINNILLTGYTGFIGKFVFLDFFIRFPKCTIYLLVRKESLSKVKKNFFNHKRIKVVVGDLGKRGFGISKKEFQELEDKIDLVIHAGAMVNHLLNYQNHYNSNVRSIFDIVRICKGYKPIVYLSSSSVYSSSPPQKNIWNERHKHENGYPASKWVTDSLLTKYYPNHMIFRLPLVIGSRRDGEVNVKDWFSKILKGFLDFKIAPNASTKNAMDMVPVDEISYLIVKGVMNRLYGKEFNISFKNSSWKEIIELVGKYFKEKKNSKLKLMGYNKWLVKITCLVQKEAHPMMPFVQTVGNIPEFEEIDTKMLKSFLMNNDKEYFGKNSDFTKVNYKDIVKYLNFIEKHM